MRPPRELIINADDLGLAPEVDRGVLRAALAGTVTSATLMVTMPGAQGGAHAARRLLALGVSVGLHVDLVTGRDVDRHDPAAVRAEVEAQAARFEALVGRPPTHLDSHKHTHRDVPAVLEAIAGLATRLSVPVRAQNDAVRAALRGRGIATPDAFAGDVGVEPYWTVERLRAAVAALPAGTTELMCHPGEPMGPIPGLFYLSQRATELSALLDPRLPSTLAAAGVRLVPFTAVG